MTDVICRENLAYKDYEYAYIMHTKFYDMTLKCYYSAQNSQLL